LKNYITSTLLGKLLLRYRRNARNDQKKGKLGNCILKNGGKALETIQSTEQGSEYTRVQVKHDPMNWSEKNIERGTNPCQGSGVLCLGRSPGTKRTGSGSSKVSGRVGTLEKIYGGLEKQLIKNEVENRGKRGDS